MLPMFLALRSLLFLLPAETAHEVTMSGLKALHRLGILKLFLKLLGVKQEFHPANFMGLHFRNRVGLAAGFDKNADYLEVCDAVGFGFVEVGTVTPLAQDGNPKPRLFRLPADHALINRMGFNNLGVDNMAHRLQTFRKRNPNSTLIVGGNIGKNKATDNELAADDYRRCYESLYPLVDYFVVNVSSPNTPNLRALQDKEPLRKIFAALRREEEVCKEKNPGLPHRPLLVKISPDNSDETVDDILEVVREFNLEGIVSSNTSIVRDGLKTDAKQVESLGAGGLSGKPLRERADALVDYLRSRDEGICIMGVGGIGQAVHAEEKVAKGADLVQVYTGFVYAGPSLISEIAKRLK